MSDADLLRRVARLEAALENTRASEPPAIRVPFAQRALNPFPQASSGNVFCDFPQSRGLTILAVNIVVYVATTNSGTKYWTLTLTNTALTTLASVNTSAIAADTFVRLTASSITQPSSSNAALLLIPTATSTPGGIYIYPELIVA